MAVDIPAPASSVYTTMSVLNADVRDIMKDPVATDGADGSRVSKAAFLRAFGRSVKSGIETKRGYKAWVNINVVNGTYEYNLSDTGTVLQVYEVLYDGEPLDFISQKEMNQRRFDADDTAIEKYTLTPGPATKIQLNVTPAENITSGLQIYALQYPSAVTDIAGQSSPLPVYYDNYLINMTAHYLFKYYEDNEEASAFKQLAAENMRDIVQIEKKRPDVEWEQLK